MEVVVTFLVALPGAWQGERPATSLAATGVGPTTLVVPGDMVVKLHLVEEAPGAERHSALEWFLKSGCAF